MSPLLVSRGCYSSWKAMTSAWSTKRVNTCMSQTLFPELRAQRLYRVHLKTLTMMAWLWVTSPQPIWKNSEDTQLRMMRSVQSFNEDDPPEKASSNLPSPPSSYIGTGSVWMMASLWKATKQSSPTPCKESTSTLCTKAIQVLMQLSTELEVSSFGQKCLRT